MGNSHAEGVTDAYLKSVQPANLHQGFGGPGKSIQALVKVTARAMFQSTLKPSPILVAYLLILRILAA